LRRRKVNVIRRAHGERFERMARELVLAAERRKEGQYGLDDLLASTREVRIATGATPRTNQLDIELEKIDDETNKQLAELQKAKDGAD
jgi:hypothetical protein